MSDSHPHFFSDDSKAYDIISDFLNKIDQWVEEVGNPELERIAQNLKRATLPGFNPTSKQMNDELRYIQWRDEILKPWKEGKNGDNLFG